MAELIAFAHKLAPIGALERVDELVEPPPPPWIDRRRQLFFENPRTFAVSISRRQWRDLPFDVIVDRAGDAGPAFYLEGPRLVFHGRELTALELQGFLARAIEDFHRAPPETRGALSHYVRRCHTQLVNCAIGYTWPGNPPGWIEFADDE